MSQLKRLREKLAASQILFEALDDGGADNDAVHTIEHHFVAPQQIILNELGDTADFLGFGFGEISEGKGPDGAQYWYADVLSRVPILSEDYSVYIPAAREAALMLTLAEAYGAEYDGWGTKMIKK